tara:strand:+ start:3350 stop:3718 length:369 start_codon:yes stop_codon:yes gene_type:complete
MTIAQKLNPTNRYYRVNGPQVPWGYKREKHDPQLLVPIAEQLEALHQAQEYLKYSSYNEVARWLTEYTGKKITGMGLWKRMKQDRSDRRKYVEQKRSAAKAQAKGNIQTYSEDTRGEGVNQT